MFFSQHYYFLNHFRKKHYLISLRHSIVLCDYIINEIKDKIEEKRPDLLADAEALIASLTYETVIAPRDPNKLINDQKDSPILNAAIIAEVDIILSGDKHFKKIDMEHPKVMTVREYFDWIEQANK